MSGPATDPAVLCPRATTPCTSLNSVEGLSAETPFSSAIAETLESTERKNREMISRLEQRELRTDEWKERESQLLGNFKSQCAV
jgi:hypothetical protein